MEKIKKMKSDEVNIQYLKKGVRCFLKIITKQIKNKMIDVYQTEFNKVLYNSPEKGYIKFII